MFTLHKQLEKDTFFISDSGFCRTLLMNNRFFPWLVLVPRKESAREIIDLTDAERHLLMDEIAAASSVVKRLFSPDKINIAALGNQVPQLHVHVIARFTQDNAWPNPVWGNGQASYGDPSPLVEELKQAFGAAHMPLK
jgi:diadenosine tetraphosphate (Ap4A) HIT family hydrolase